MRRLIVMRHAKTERRAESGQDFARALTPGGQADAAATAHALAAAGLVPDLALVSDAVRTRQTFAAMRDSLPDVRLETAHALYDASDDALWRAAQAAEGDTLLLVAHNPGVHALAMRLAQRCVAIGVEARAALEAGFPTASAAAFEFATERAVCLGVYGPGASGR